MDWANERYVRLFTRDTPEWLCWSWQARALWPLLIRKVDRSGVLANKLGPRGVAALVGLPIEVVEVGMPDLLADGCLAAHQLGYVVPNYIEAQETPTSDKQRKRDSRERRRVVTIRDIGSQNVTNGHAVSREVTPCRAFPVPEELSPARAILPSTEPVLDPSTLQERQALRKELLLELNEARQAVAAEIGVEHRPLLAQDPGERALALLITQASGDHRRVVADARHAIAVASAEAIRDRSLRWLTGVIFEERNYRRLVGATVTEARRSRAGPRREERPKPLRYTSKDPEPDLSYDPHKT